MTEAVPLPGGYVNEVVRIGDTVRRRVRQTNEFVHELLLHLDDWPGSPRFLGLDDEGREILTFIDGHVAWKPEQPAAVRGEPSLLEVARLVRELHDRTAGTTLAGAGEVVCHNDLSPKNTVYRDGGSGLRAVAFIDCDIATPGRRIHDVAHMLWQYLRLGPSVSDPLETARLARVMCDAYGLEDRGEVVQTVLWWQERCWRGIELKADEGEPAMVRLRDLGGAGWVRADHDWTTAHRAELEAALA